MRFIHSIIILLILISGLYPLIGGQVTSNQFEINDINSDFSMSNNIEITNQNLQREKLISQEDFINKNPVELIESIATSDAIETSAITNEVHSPGRDSYIVDFGYHQTYTFSAQQIVYSGVSGYLGFQETVFFGVHFALPVNITLTYDDQVEAGKGTSIDVNLYKTTGAGFWIDYGFILEGDYKIGFMGSNKHFTALNYTNKYEILAFDVPLDPIPLTEFTFPLPLDALIPGISSLFMIALLLAPQLDADISANLFNNGLGFTDPQSLKFDTEEQKSFTIETDTFATNKTDVAFGLTDFSMDFKLSLLWSLQAKFMGVLGFLNWILGPFKLKLFTYPTIPIGGLPTDGITAGFHDLLPSQELPDFDLDSYVFDDSTGNNNGILEPGETATLTSYIANYGSGGAINANITTSSDNVTISTPTGGLVVQATSTLKKEYLQNIYPRGGRINHSVDITLDPGYTDRNVNITYDVTWISPNGSIATDTIDLTLRVLQSGDAFLNLDSWSIFEPNDGYWDAGEDARLFLDFSKTGTAGINYADVDILGIDLADFTSNSTFDSITSTLTTWNSSRLVLTAPTTIESYRVQVLLWVSYDIASGPTYDDFWIVSFDIWPLSPFEDLNYIQSSFVSGFDDGIFQAGESFDLTAEIQNLGTDTSGTVYGLIVSNSTDVYIEDNLIIWNDHAPPNTAISTNSILMEISEFAETKSIELTLYLLYYTWYGEEIIDQFTVILNIVQQPNPTLVLNYYDVTNLPPAALEINQVDNLAPGTMSLVTVNIGVNDGPGYDAISILSSNNSDINIVNDTSYYGDIEIGLSSNGEGFLVYVPDNFKGGFVEFEVNVTIYSAVGDVYYQTGIFVINIAQGDVLDPLYSAEYPAAAKVGVSITIVIDTFDENGIDAVYFGYFNYSIDDWDVYILNWINASAVSITLEMPNNDLLFAFMVVDNSGNIVTVGTDIALSINLIPETTTTSTSTTSSTTSSVATSSATTSSSVITTNTSTDTTSSVSSQIDTQTSTKKSTTTEKTDVGGLSINLIQIMAGIGLISLISIKRQKN